MGDGKEKVFLLTSAGKLVAHRARDLPPTPSTMVRRRYKGIYQEARIGVSEHRAATCAPNTESRDHDLTPPRLPISPVGVLPA